MMGLFPKPYEDELAYSLFSRYFVRSGYIYYASAAEDLFVNSKCNPNVEFCNLLSNDAQRQVKSIREFITNHTMLNYYLAFLSPSNQERARTIAFSMDMRQLMNALPIPQGRAVRSLKYCPMCMQDDRNKNGETFWHRAHQMYGVNVCYKHGCYLQDSIVSITSDTSPALFTAEECAMSSDVEMSENELEKAIATYANDVLRLSTTSKSTVSAFLRYKLIGSKYVSIRGAKRNISLLSKDFLEFYKGIDVLGFGEAWQLEKVFSNHRTNPFEICLLGLFLGVTAREVVVRDIDETTDNIGHFDSYIQQLRKEGLNYKQISQALGISYDYCKVLGSGKKKHQSIERQRSKRKTKIDWCSLDDEYLDKAKALIDEMTSCATRPQRISAGRAEKLLGLKEGQLRKMPKTLKVVRDNMISQEEFWALEVLWAINKLRDESKVINITNIMKLTNMRKAYFYRAYTFLMRYVDTPTIEQLGLII